MVGSEESHPQEAREPVPNQSHLCRSSSRQLTMGVALLDEGHELLHQHLLSARSSSVSPFLLKEKSWGHEAKEARNQQPKC